MKISRKVQEREEGRKEILIAGRMEGRERKEDRKIKEGTMEERKEGRM